MATIQHLTLDCVYYILRQKEGASKAIVSLFIGFQDIFKVVRFAWMRMDGLMSTSASTMSWNSFWSQVSGCLFSSHLPTIVITSALLRKKVSPRFGPPYPRLHKIIPLKSKLPRYQLCSLNCRCTYHLLKIAEITVFWIEKILLREHRRTDSVFLLSSVLR